MKEKGFALPLVLVFVALVTMLIGVFAYFQIKPKPLSKPQQIETMIQSSPTPKETAIRKEKREKIISDGSRVTDNDLGISFVPIKGAEVDFWDSGQGELLTRVFFFKGSLTNEEAFGTHLIEGIVINISQVSKDKQINLREFADEKTKYPGYASSGRKEFTKIFVDGNESYLAVSDYDFTWGDNQHSVGESAQIYMEVNQKVYLIESVYTGANFSSYKIIFQEFLSSFKFQ